jgi:uncharacterized membrane protein YkvA (DUF1232 family)
LAKKSFKVSFHLDEEDAAYFRNLLQTARRNVAPEHVPQIIQDVRELITRVKEAKKAPRFVLDATQALEDLSQMLEDEDYALPRGVAVEALGALGYFADPEDLVPDHIPALGFLDDAIMMKLVEEEFRHELWAYRKFRSFRSGAEQQPREKLAEDPRRLEQERNRLRAKVKEEEGEGRRTGWLGGLLRRR